MNRWSLTFSFVQQQDEEALFSAVSGTGGYAAHRRAAGSASRAAGDNPANRTSTRSSAVSSGGCFGGGSSSAAYAAANAHTKSSWGAGNVLNALNGTAGTNIANSMTTSDPNSCAGGNALEQHQRNLKPSAGNASGHSGHVAKVAGGALKELRENLESAAKENQKKYSSKNGAPVEVKEERLVRVFRWRPGVPIS